MAGTPGDLETAKLFLREAQKHLHITPTHDLPIYDAGTEESRNSILDISHLHSPKAWIDTYYPVMNTPGERSLQALNKDGSVLLNIELEEPYDPTDPAGKLGNAVPAFHGFSADGEAIGKVRTNITVIKSEANSTTKAYLCQLRQQRGRHANLK